MPKHAHHSSYLGFAWGEGKKTNHPSATITAQFPGFDHKCVDVQSCSALVRVGSLSCWQRNTRRKPRREIQGKVTNISSLLESIESKESVKQQHMELTHLSKQDRAPWNLLQFSCVCAIKEHHTYGVFFAPLQYVPIAFTPSVSHIALSKGLHFTVSCWHMNTLQNQSGHVLKNENQNRYCMFSILLEPVQHKPLWPKQENVLKNTNKQDLFKMSHQPLCLVW